ncbi:putative phospholipase B-like 2 isoform X2 [Dermacentor andersoni]|uniref:putative phospholipase B-like 2 isoform X2 n=1 Tax=Dermacentor andersoni TaxID=34620 RepID=UPI0024160951|nr:putative phospholipase B-like 2 isoform X2 [Dermacentor andersoni]
MQRCGCLFERDTRKMEPSKRLQLTLAALAVLAQAACGLDAWVKFNPSPTSFEVKLGRPSTNDQVAAWGSFHNAINETGFSFLEIYTNAELADEHQAYAAGFLEGYVTRDLIRMHFNNMWASYCDDEQAYCKRLYTFLRENFVFMHKNIAEYRKKKSAYWYQVNLVLLQLKGMEDGRTPQLKQSFPSEPDFNVTETLFLNLHGDVQDLEMVLKRRVVSRVTGDGSCSALVKVLPLHKDLYVSHNTWTKYSSMLRILKKYRLPYREAPGSEKFIPGHTMTFSSYPGRIFSGDDFYLISSGLATMETTIGNENDSLYSFVTPESNLEFIRNVVSNRLAFSGDEWTRIFSRYNSGTYNNQWMVVDYKRFKPGMELEDGLLYVLEQLPTCINVTDVTQTLRDQTYWASYNVPAFEYIYNISGWWRLVEKYGDWFTYDKTPRALMFLRDHIKVRDMDSMIKLMRYNDYKNDPLSRCNCTPPYSAENAISARSDLNPADGIYPFPSLGHRSHGGTDMKLANFSLMGRLEFVAVSGPTWDQQPPFRWSTSELKDRHEGHPDLWKFEPFVHHWLSMKPDFI